METQKFIGKEGRMSKPKGCPDSLWTVVDQCWHQTPAKRGTFAQLVSKLSVLEAQNPPPTVRDIGAMLTDPAVDKRAKAEQAKVDVARKELVEASKVKREGLVEQARIEKATWYHPNIPKKIADKQLLKYPEGTFLVREERMNEKLLLCVNEAQTVTAFTIRVEASQSRPGQFRYTFAGKPHTSLEHIIGNLKAMPFRGMTKTIQLGDACPIILKSGVEKI
jgi:hypothetical protein